MVKFGAFDRLADSGIGLAPQYVQQRAIAEACDWVGSQAYHLAEHHGMPHGFAPSQQ